MKYIYRDSNGVVHFDQYFAYLEEISDRLPPRVRTIALDRRRYTLNDSETLHDAWLDSLQMHEAAAAQDSNRRAVQVELRLLGPFHDRYFEFRYQDVSRYIHDELPEYRCLPSSNGHGDLLFHEFTLVAPAVLRHELQFSSGRRIQIECVDITWEEIHFAK